MHGSQTSSDTRVSVSFRTDTPIRTAMNMGSIWQRFINSDRALSSREIPRGHLLVELAHGPAHGAEGGLRESAGRAEGGLREG